MSGLKIHSLGIVVEDKVPGEDWIIVTPIEELNIQEDGLIKDKEYTVKGDLDSLDKKEFNTEFKSKNVIKARWISLGQSNRMTAPDVYKNETVLLFQYSETEEYYWTTIFREPKLRRLESVVYFFSNETEFKKDLDRKNSYWLEVNTRKKLVEAYTANNDGEKTWYSYKVDTKNGVIHFEDKIGNKTTLISDPGNYSAYYKISYKLETHDGIGFTSRYIWLNAENVTINADELVINAKKVVINGDVRINGTLTVSKTVKGNPVIGFI